jgi:hypothetical protein
MKLLSKNSFFIVLISSIFTYTLCWGMKEEGKGPEIKAPVYRGLLVFLDDSELQTYGPDLPQNYFILPAITKALLWALDKKASPIVTSKSLLYLARTKNENLKNEPGMIKISINFDDWIIKEIVSNLCLLIHKNSLASLSLSEDDINAYSPDKITIAEFKLGLKINHMPRCTQIYPKDPSSKKKSPESFAQSMDKIFCTKTDYLKECPKEFDIHPPIWSLYLNGHGYMGKTVAGIPIDLFRTHVLSFLRDQIHTRLLFYASCYAAGTNAEEIYFDAKKQTYETYPFTIITNALTDAPTDQPKQLNFDAFLSEVTQADSIDYKYLVSTVSQLSPQTKATWETVPQIKLPGLEWFSVLADDNGIVSIDPELAMTYKHPVLDIDTYFQPKQPRTGKNIDIIFSNETNPRALLLYANNIPFELATDSERMEAIISMIPGKTAHKIKKISSSYWNVDYILNWFITVKQIDAYKIFSIEEIAGKDKTINDIIIYSRREAGWTRIAVFKQSNQYYLQSANYATWNKNKGIYENRITFGKPQEKTKDDVLHYYEEAEKLFVKTKDHNLQKQQVKAARETWQRLTAEK